MKGVILAGGTGSRLRPLTKIINKHLLPVGSDPMIYWPISKLRDAGICDIMIVTNQHHLSSFIELLGLGEAMSVNLVYQIQKTEGGGIADALLGAKEFIGEDKFVVLLGDNIFEDSLAPYVHAFHSQKTGARVLLKQVEDPGRYGVPELDHAANRIRKIREKPVHPASSFCVTGIYMYDQEVFRFIKKIQPSERNELEITDVNNLYIQSNELQFDILSGWWIDAGTHESLFKATQYVYEGFSKESSF
ncbi:sugar phosphate nucleotidyltransferase [Metabacillus sp. 113a]|uniref:sugar phosphate nucleotidyltransferase n=1 Tax=Metabacillus sp. 113a TaxID=3404706 RepID=UPI003CF3E88E